MGKAKHPKHIPAATMGKRIGRLHRQHATASAALSKPNSKTPSPSSSASQPNTLTLLQQSNLTSDEWFRAPRTKKGYAGYVKAGKAWLGTWTAEEL
ncbi:hypothetical protein HGRIS_011979 [Hohenbuehelia grisea]|uniref:Uncharacterized protein n=1 Tax=Hohenbuehelia grisea TaxID=104357 RepID=A0ABR3JYT1_9AGAR